MKKMKIFLSLAAFVAIAGGAFFIKTNVVEAHTRTVKIAVDKTGFSPSTIEAEAGHKLNLVFTRSGKTVCGEVNFPQLKIRKSLPVGKDVIVSVNPTEAGQINFSCGKMNGKIVVTD